MALLNLDLNNLADPSNYSTKKLFINSIKNLLNKTPDVEYAIVCVDIVGFQLINEKFGTEYGDKFLIFLAKEIRDYRKPKNGVLFSCYASSDKFFLMYLYEDFDPDKLLFDLSEIFRKWSDSYEIEAKLGIAKLTGDLDPSQVCERAKIAVNSAKRLYDKKYAYFDMEMIEKISRENFMLKSMSKAITKGEFLSYFQPQIDANTQKIVGAEVLVRWNSKTNGFVSPNDFVPLFEKTGSITELDMYIWGIACSYFEKWREKGYDIPHISLNMSRADFYHKNIANYLFKLVEKHKLNPKDVHIEITESAFYENHEQFLKILEKFGSFGFVVEIDDFGSGYSSLNMLTEYKFDVIKFDKDFISANKSLRGQTILSSAIKMIKEIGMTVVTEGIETESDYEFVKSAGADIIQGYYFSKPLSVEDFEKVLSGERSLN